MFDRRLFRNFDYLLFLSVLTLGAISLVIISSATHSAFTDDPFFFTKRQGLFFAVGLIAMLVVLSIDYTQFYRFAPAMYVFNMLMLAAVLFIGDASMGAQRWIDIGFFRFQPSEFAKIIAIITLARHLTSKEGELDSIFSPIPIFLHVAVPFILIFLQPDLGTSLVFIVITFGMLFMAGAQGKHLFTYIAVGVAVGFPLLWYNLMDYQRMRILVFLNPEIDPLGSGFQIMQSMIAVGSGGLWGKGLFAEGTQNYLDFLPEQHTDFIFSTMAEEIGFVGSVLVLLLFLFLVLRVIRIASQSKDTFGMLICIGVATMITCQVLVGVGMAIGMMPVKGLPLPFLSSGGSSLIMNMIAIGVVLNVGMRRHKLMF